MSEEFSSDDLRNAWQNQNVPSFHMTPAEIRKRIEQFDQKMRKRKSIGYVVCLTAIACNVLAFFVVPNLIARIGAVLTCWGAAYILCQVHLYHRNRKSAAIMAAKKGNVASAEFYRAELHRIREFTCGIWLWSRIAMILPGPLVFMIGFQLSYQGIAPFVYAEMALFLILLALAVPLNLKISRRYQRQIDELQSLQKER